MGRGLAWNAGCDTSETLPISQRTHVTVQLHGNGLQVSFDGREVCQVRYLEKEPGHTNVKVYAGDPWYTAADALLWGMHYVPLALTWLPSPTWLRLRRTYLIDRISTAVDFELTFSIKPTGIVLGWSNLLHFTTRGNHGAGGRIPGIWFHSLSTRLHVRMGRGLAWNAGCDTSETLPINRMTYVTVRLHGTSLQVVFNSRVVCKADYPTKEPGHMGVDVYAGDPWYKPARALVSDLRYIPLVTAT